MRIKKRMIFYAVSTMGVLAILVLRRELSIKISEPSDKSIKNGKSILDNPCKILAISAHPDDLEFFAGGLLSVLQYKGHEVHIVDVTDGEKGVRRKNLAKTRRNEQIKAGRALGISNIHFLNLPDLKLDEIDSLDNIIKRCIEEIKPDIILTFDYQKPIKVIIHPDHIKVGKSSAEAIDQLTEQKPILLYYASREPNTIVDITDFLKNKIKAVQQHKSQIRFSPKLYALFVKAFARYSSLNSGFRYAESFRMEKVKYND